MKNAIKQFQEIPGIGKSIARDLVDLGYSNLSELCNSNPENMYRELCELQGARIDRCVLYVFRCAVYYVRNTKHEPELLKWWNWKDKT